LRDRLPATNLYPGGYSEFMTAPDEAVITFHGNE
jgi:hypothetical protein